MRNPCIRVPIMPAYLDAVNRAKAGEAMTVKVDWCTTWDAEGLLRHFRKGVLGRASRGLNQTGRKFSDDYQSALVHDSRIIEDHYSRRVHHSGRNILNCPELKRRFPLIDNPAMEY